MSITLETVKARIYFVGNTFPIKDRIKSIGGHWDGDRSQWWVGAAKRADAEKLVAAADSPSEKKPQDPSDIRLTGKGRYKGRVYYAGSITRDGTKVRLLTLPDADGKYLDFWAPCSEVEEIKRYQPREHTYRGRTETFYTTLGSIASFIEKQKEGERTGEICADCGLARPLIEDLEDGMMKCRSCCDIPSE